MTKKIRHPQYEVAVIGAGPGGIAAGAKLRMSGIDDIVILERADDVGGSWQENRYPGIAVDVPSTTYQYSFARNPNWSRFFAHGPEVQQYHADVARRYGLYEKTRFNSNVEREEWDDTGKFWVLHLDNDSIVTARFLISAIGAFVRPKEDAGLPGADSFQGKIQRPTAWDYDYDMAGKSVGIIGTGASAVQIIPAIAATMGSLEVFQRTPVWSVPKPDFVVPKAMQAALAVPGVSAAINGVAFVVVDLLLRLVSKTPIRIFRPVADKFDAGMIAGYRWYVRHVVEDAETAAKLSPDFGVLAKRPTMSTGYLTAYNRDNVTLITDPIAEITPTGIRTRDGVLHELDVLILATGYEVFSDPETYVPGTIVGRDGFDLAEFYRDEGLQAYQSVSVPGLPNRWTLVGPYSWSGTSWHAFVETTADHAVRAITETRRRGADVCEVRKEAADEYHRKVHKQAEGVRYYLCELNGHVPTYYRNSQGDSTYIRPESFFAARRRTRRFPLDDYRYETTGSTSSVPAVQSSAAPIAQSR
ncbi:NAD(P)/FAD-dependent oxidoreductase [Nocardia colli]|uniref:NAD(P)/FAD-dependent oxidoreductase n=1 Tax=Nocardia colli TaxID=2545717 RepID=A0A5N0E8X3_9NOCA|nr:NAD(P)/FAD-dependent oxidoreductase [Nocardia colli]KAA8884889.1 NAD(P)/FAD-dependent oxidoreductase [Nocardia colli]